LKDSSRDSFPESGDPMPSSISKAKLQDLPALLAELADDFPG
jgi:hypothetical protein